MLRRIKNSSTRFLPAASLAVFFAGVCAAQTGSITLTFEGLQDTEQVLNYYNGGSGSLGSGPGPNYGITFGAAARATVLGGGSGNFDGNPTGISVVQFAQAGSVMNVPAGFTGGFSLYYDNPNPSGGTIAIYDGPNATGNLLGTLNLDGTGSFCDSLVQYSCWGTQGVSFSGTAQSVSFGNNLGILFDNITIGSPTPGGSLVMNCLGPNGPVSAGTQYSAVCTLYGGMQPYSWGYDGLPSWLTPSGNTGSGISISGTAPTPPPGSYSFDVIGVDNTDTQVSQSIAITVTQPTLTIDCTPGTSTILAGSAYSLSCTASAGTPPYNWTFPNLPSWLQASGSTGPSITLSGTAPNPPPGSYNFTATVTDSSTGPSGPQHASEGIAIFITPLPLSLNCNPLTGSVVAGNPYSITCSFTGGPLTFQGLPSWLTPNQSGSPVTLSGTAPSPPPTQYSFSASVFDGSTQQTASQTIAIVVIPKLSVSCTAPVGSVVAGAPYSASCTASGGTPAYAWTFGGVPSWLSPSGTSGATIMFTGTVPSPPPSSFSVTATATDTTTPTAQTAGQTIAIVVVSKLNVSCVAPTGPLVTGTPYSAICTASGGTPGYTWSFTGVPSWLSPSGTSGASITLTGTVPSPPPSSFSVTATAKDTTTPTAQTAAQTIAITVVSKLNVSCVAPTGQVVTGASYSAVCTASGGTPGYTWSFAGLPSWLLPSGTSGATITLTGTVPSPPPSSFSVTATATDSTTGAAAQTASQTIAISVVSKLNISCNAPTGAIAGTLYSASCTASGGVTAYSWTFPGLPSWLSPSGSSGATITLTGTPPSPPPSSYSFSATVTDSTTPTPQAASQTIAIAVTPKLNVSCTAPVGSVVTGTPYSASCTASGGTPAYAWTFGGVPSWLTPSGTSGATIMFTGTVPSPPPSSYSFTATATDTTTPTAQTAAQNIAIAVVSKLNVSCVAASGQVVTGTSYSAICTASGGSPGYTWSFAGVPSWLSPSGTSGASITFTGTVPSAPPSSFSVTATATDSTTRTAQTASQTIAIAVVPKLNISCTVPSGAVAGTPYSGTCTASGGAPGYSWTFPGIPSWLSPSGTSGANITLSGTPPFPPPASYSFTATVTDITTPTAQTASQSIAIGVSPPKLNISCSAPAGSPLQGAQYLVTCSASGGTGADKWTASGASWLALSSNTGNSVALTGIVPPSPPSSYSLVVTVTDSGLPTPQNTSQTITINISPISVIKMGCLAPTGAVAPGTQYSAVCAVAGGTPGFNWTFSGLPPWLVPSATTGSTITFTGTVPSPPPSSYSVNVNVSDSGASPNAQTASQTFTIAVSTKLSVSCVATSNSIVAGTAYSTTCTASVGTPGFSWSFTGLPSWLSPSGTTGATITLTGTAPSPPPASYSFTATVTDSTTPIAQTASQTIAITVVSKLNVSCALALDPRLGAAAAGSQFSATCQASGGTPGAGYRWTFSGLPSWLSPSGNTGASITLTGTVPSPPPASYSFTVTVTDSTTPTAQTASQNVTIPVVSPQLNISCTPSSSSVTAATQYSAKCTGSGGTPGSGYSWTFSGLPSWLSSNTTTGAAITLSGTVPGPPPSSYTVSVTVTDNSTPLQESATQTITISVVAAPLQLFCTAPTAAVLAGTRYFASCVAAGGTLPYTISSANLPSWLTLSSGGLTGIVPNPPPTSYSFTVTATDSSTPTNQTANQTISISVTVPPLQGVTITQNSNGSAPNQTNLSVSLPSSAQGSYTATLSLSFKPDPSITNVPANYVDPAAGFPASGQGTTLTQNLTVNAGATPPSVVFAEGTVAGTWTVTLTSLTTGGVSALSSPAPSYTVPVALAAPQITVGSVKIVNATATGFSVTLTGFATSRDVASGTFVFAAASGAQLQGGTTTVPFNGLDQSQWFNTAAGQGAGGTFSLTLPFAYSGDPNALGSVTVTLTNSKGQTSTPVSGGK